MTWEAAAAANNDKYVKGCPHFALLDDPDTSLLFPSSLGYCHRAHPPVSVQIGHQERFCLTAQHIACPVFTGKGRAPLLKNGQIQQETTPRRRGRGVRALGSIVVLLALTLLLLWIIIWITDQPFTGEAAIPTQAAVAVLPEVVVTVAPTPMATAVPATPTQTATPFPTITPVPTAELPPTFTPVPPPITAVISETMVNIHTGPAASYPILQAADQVGARFDVIGQIGIGGWWQICCINGAMGWVAASSVVISGNTETLPVLPIPSPQIAILASRLNVRSGPGVDYDIIEVLEEGAVVDMVGRLRDGSWWQICCVADGAIGWVINDGVEVWGYAEMAPIVAAPPSPTETPIP